MDDHSRSPAAASSTGFVVLGVGGALYDVVRPWGTLPPGWNLGLVSHVAVDSQDRVYFYQRQDPPVLVFDREGNFLAGWGDGRLRDAHGIYIGPDDHVYLCNRDEHEVLKMTRDGRIVLALGQRGRPALRAPFNHPADVAVAPDGDIYVADGYGNSRVAKYDRNGKWIKNWGSTGTTPGQFRVVHGIQIDAANNVYVADRDNRRIQVFDTEGTFKTQFRNVGSPWAICITPAPRQFLYVSNSNPPNNLDYDGEIIKMTLDGRIVGKFGRAGKLLKEFGTANSLDCRSENEIYVGELGNWRVQKVTLKAK